MQRPEPSIASTVSFRGRGDRKTRRLSDSILRRTVATRAIARAPARGVPGGTKRQPGEHSAVGGKVAKLVNGHGIADRVTGQGVRLASPPDQRVKPEGYRNEVENVIPGQVVIPRMSQFVGEDRTQLSRVMLGAHEFGQQENRPPGPGETGRLHLGRSAHLYDRPARGLVQEAPPFVNPLLRNALGAADDFAKLVELQQVSNCQNQDPRRPDARHPYAEPRPSRAEKCPWTGRLLVPPTLDDVPWRAARRRIVACRFRHGSRTGTTCPSELELS